ncbi:transient receptor potential channel pyrexia-like [Phlebotomus papatasi]|uniref:transient receptor potential channel pyrexia-like n=1 Tax=Phlebotomus papatasi TaxID=29031 RepID=UPI002483522E|nr:transient receptor potential channel pyrexia-like [Phlebotomus papatasi]
MKHLLDLGGDLSKMSIEIDPNSLRHTEKESVFQLIMTHLCEPIKFLTDLLNQRINVREKENNYEFILDFTILTPGIFSENSIREMNVLGAIVNATNDIHSEEYELLKHPLIVSFLTCKWKHFRIFFFFLVFLHLSFVLTISTGAILATKSYQKFYNDTHHWNFTQLPQMTDDSSRYSSNTIFAVKTLNIISISLAILLLLHAIIQATFIPLVKLIWEFEVMLNLITAPLAILTSSCVIYHSSGEGFFENHHRWIFHMMSAVVLPAWINLMLIVGRFPRLGCYSLMFTTVLRNFLKVMISFIFLIIGFALSFQLIFLHSEFFSDPAQATMRTIVMMLGEFDYTSTFSQEHNVSLMTFSTFIFQVISFYFIIGTSRLIFLIFIISCSIILMNLTQGIAVNDIKLLHEISQEIRLEKETRFLYELENVFSHRFVIGQPVLRKLKKRFFDNGTQITYLIVNRKMNSQGLSVSLYDKLLKSQRTIK